MNINLQYFGGRGSAGGTNMGGSGNKAVVESKSPEGKITRDYTNRTEKITSLKNGQTITYDATKQKDTFKSNGLSDVVYNASLALKKGDIIEVSTNSGPGYKVQFLVTAEYSNGNRSYAPLYNPKDAGKLLAQGADRTWKSITQGAAWLDFPAKYKIRIRKAK